MQSTHIPRYVGVRPRSRSSVTAREPAGDSSLDDESDSDSTSTTTSASSMSHVSSHGCEEMTEVLTNLSNRFKHVKEPYSGVNPCPILEIKDYFAPAAPEPPPISSGSVVRLTIGKFFVMAKQSSATCAARLIQALKDPVSS